MARPRRPTWNSRFHQLHQHLTWPQVPARQSRSPMSGFRGHPNWKTACGPLIRCIASLGFWQPDFVGVVSIVLNIAAGRTYPRRDRRLLLLLEESCVGLPKRCDGHLTLHEPLINRLCIGNDFRATTLQTLSSLFHSMRLPKPNENAQRCAAEDSRLGPRRDRRIRCSKGSAIERRLHLFQR